MPKRDAPTPDAQPKGPKSLGALSSFAALAKKAARLDSLDRALRQTLPLPLREQARFADLRYGRLVFVVSSPAWASRLRTLQGSLVATARSLGVEAESIKIKVSPVPSPPPAPPPPKVLSPAAAVHLHAASRATSDPEMRELLEKLAALASRG